MNTIASEEGLGIEEQAAPRSLADRLLAAIPLASVYSWLCVIGLVEAWQHLTPWLFTDELELTQLSRSIADTGHAARRGVPITPHTLYVFVTAPLWLIHDVSSAYAAIKYFDVFAMTSVVFPTYFLARLLVGRRAALFAAAGAGAIPSLAYSSYIVEETIAYPYAALCLFLIAKAFVRHARRERWRAWAAAAVVASAVAPAVRGELAMIPVTLVLTGIFVAWSSDRARRWRTTWSTGDWMGTVLLVFGVIFVISAIGSQESLKWLGVTRYYKDRILDQGNWAAGALAIGLGVVPVVAGLAALVRAPGEERSHPLRVFRSVTVASVITFGLYTAMKAAYLSTQFGTRVEERNLIYIAPLLFVGTAVVLERRRVNLAALAATGAYGVYLVGYAVYHAVGTPYEMGIQLYSDALGFSILQQANRYIALDIPTARLLLIGVAVLGILLLAAPRLLRGHGRAVSVLTAAVAVGVVGWNLTGEVAAGVGSASLSRAAADTLRHPFGWVDAVTGGKPTLYMGEGEYDQNPEWLLEFWNRSITRVSSLDGTVQGPGPSGSPNIRQDGALFWGSNPTDLSPQFDYAVEDQPCVDFVGTRLRAHPHRAGGLVKTWRLVRLAKPNRLLAECTGISPDGWTGPHDSAYFRFGKGRGWLKVVISRRNAAGPPPPSPVHVLLGKLVVNANHAPILGKLTKRWNGTIAKIETKTVWLRTTTNQFAVHVVVDRKFVPHLVDPSSSDTRHLGAQVTYTFYRTRPKP